MTALYQYPVPTLFINSTALGHYRKYSVDAIHCDGL
jgi:hypothetical protein